MSTDAIRARAAEAIIDHLLTAQCAEDEDCTVCAGCGLQLDGSGDITREHARHIASLALTETLAERDALVATVARVAALVDIMERGPDCPGESLAVTQAWTYAADAIRAAVGPRDRRAPVHCGFTETHEPHADRDTYCDGSRCLAHPPTPPVDEADVETLAAWFSNEGDGGIWEHFDATNAREVARRLLATGRVRVTR